ncbi:hypothetical protein SAMN05660860_02670 [Geoalkalibacter ferrihydriticus]|uniref:Uncharacterized protein n=2 Tax=Geoalkalibacter ferrihydriticus TaxID=392333 RepID=A0A0C2E9Z8_9BACT|nr:hypothetical protein [Geoalkalibacter ferrihydriticus]KIH75398.1 hypothetical protein GFER_16995 [Geoalkalibacter ferrihydriticus DSM 17813]SDM52862.1 hypothetical protein SAMN05660860_02670 [Geoalkalibacter ferrihydriticus]
MKRINFDDYVRENRGSFTRTRLARDRGRQPMARPRSREECAILLRLDRARRRQWLEQGKLEILGPRKFRLKF